MSEAYLQFLKSKIPQAEVAGFEPPTECHPSLFPHQRDIATWAIRGGRRAVFANFGLGKTRIHLQIAAWVVAHTGGRYLIVAPLGVRQEFTLSDGPAMGLAVEYVRTNAEVQAAKSSILITNYERVRDGDIDLTQFAGAGLDESSVLRSFGSKTYQEFLSKFKDVPFRWVFTATPSPNRYKELIHYGGFLGIMDTGEALTRFFQRDSEQAGNLTLYPHMERQFWLWLHSWAVFIQRPSDLGYSDEGYELPPMEVHWHRLETDHRKAWKQVDGWGQAQLLRDDAQGLKEGAEIKRESIDLRVAELEKLIVTEGICPEKQIVVWCDLNDEQLAIERMLKRLEISFSSLTGAQGIDEREELIMAWKRRETSVFLSKPVMYGAGVNLQQCWLMAYLGVGYKFADFIQGVHRIFRFMQTHACHIHIFHLDSEDAIVAVMQDKWRRHNELMARMTELLKTHRLSTQTTMELIRTLGCDRAEVRGDRFTVVRNDCVLELEKMEANSIDMICTSIPFGNQYEYSPSYNDFGHNTGNDAFFEQMGFLCPELLRVLKPGRIAAIHVKDRIQFGNVTGHGCPTVEPFSDLTTVAFRKAGFVLMARITIDTDVVRENAQTYRLGWSENAKDSTKMGAGMPEYVLIFRKLPTDHSVGYADTPVKKDKATYTRADWQLDASGLWRSNGNRLLDPEIMMGMNMEEIKRWWTQYSLAGGYSHEEHVALAKALEKRGKLPSSFMLFPPISRNKDIWTDIARMRTLNTEQSRRAEEKHVCPLQLDLIRRLIGRYTEPGELVMDPFNGIGSVTYQALKEGRKAYGIELNAEYWRFSVGFCEQVESEQKVPTLFDFADLTAKATEVAEEIK